jgi:hypothetical protein
MLEASILPDLKTSRWFHSISWYHDVAEKGTFGAEAKQHWLLCVCLDQASKRRGDDDPKYY